MLQREEISERAAASTISICSDAECVTHLTGPGGAKTLGRLYARRDPVAEGQQTGNSGP